MIIASWQHAVGVEKIEKDQTDEIRWDNSSGKYIVKDLADLRLLGQIEDDTLIWHPSTQILQMYFAFPSDFPASREAVTV